MDPHQNIAEDIDMQIAMGFSTDEIKSNMALKGHSADAVQNYLDMKALKARKEKRKPNYLQYFISVVIIIGGIVDVTSNKSGYKHSWGYVLIAIGSIGLILQLMVGDRMPNAKL